MLMWKYFLGRYLKEKYPNRKLFCYVLNKYIKNLNLNLPEISQVTNINFCNNKITLKTVTKLKLSHNHFNHWCIKTFSFNPLIPNSKIQARFKNKTKCVRIHKLARGFGAKTRRNVKRVSAKGWNGGANSLLNRYSIAHLADAEGHIR